MTWLYRRRGPGLVIKPAIKLDQVPNRVGTGVEPAAGGLRHDGAKPEITEVCRTVRRTAKPLANSPHGGANLEIVDESERAS